MNFEDILKNAPTIHTDGRITLPTLYEGEVNFIIPDKIVDFCIRRYNLINNNSRIIDPMCGVGTIPRIINSHGGDCLGIEIDVARFIAAQNDAHSDKIKLGNYLEIDLEHQFFNCLFTSMPFDWFKEETFAASSDHANKFRQLLTPDGFILLDSIPLVDRDDQKWPVASRQCEYLETHGFTLKEIIRFINDDHADSTNESVIMHFMV